MAARKERYISEVFSLIECYVLKNENLRYNKCHLKPNKMSCYSLSQYAELEKGN